MGGGESELQGCAGSEDRGGEGVGGEKLKVTGGCRE